ncbi:MAG: hypothetical protein V3S69_06300 [Dehalococcoidales bacterium]
MKGKLTAVVVILVLIIICLAGSIWWEEYKMIQRGQEVHVMM